MQKNLSLLILGLVLVSCQQRSSSTVPVVAQSVVAGANCFKGWVSSAKNNVPTGYCQETTPEGESKVMSRVEIDFPSQRLYIHGSVSHSPSKSSWFRFEATSCEDVVEGGWTFVNGVSATGEKYELRHREIKEIPPTGKAVKAFSGEAQLHVEIDGEKRDVALECVRYVF